MYNQWHSGIYNRTHVYSTRNRDDLLPNQARLTISQNSLSHAGPNIWNSIPLEIKNSPSRNSFKFNFKRHLLSFYSVEPWSFALQADLLFAPVKHSYMSALHNICSWIYLTWFRINQGSHLRLLYLHLT